MYSVLTSNECCPFHTIFRYRSKAVAEVVKIGFHCCCSYSLTLSVCAAWCWLRSFKSSYNIPLCRAHVKLKQIMQVFCFLQRFALSVFFLLRLYIFIGLATVNNNCDFFQRSLPAKPAGVMLILLKRTHNSQWMFLFIVDQHARSFFPLAISCCVCVVWHPIQTCRSRRLSFFSFVMRRKLK